MATTNDIQWRTVNPPNELNEFAESFWMLANYSDKEHQIVILPDGRFDIIFSLTGGKKFQAGLKGLDNVPEQRTIPPKSIFFAVSFKLLAVEYLLEEKLIRY